MDRVLPIRSAGQERPFCRAGFQRRPIPFVAYWAVIFNVHLAATANHQGHLFLLQLGFERRILHLVVLAIEGKCSLLKDLDDLAGLFEAIQSRADATIIKPKPRARFAASPHKA